LPTFLFDYFDRDYAHTIRVERDFGPSGKSRFGGAKIPIASAVGLEGACAVIFIFMNVQGFPER
jgi:hypothetical protein